MKNEFCKLNDLRNEADVEQIFLRRLFEHAEFSDKQIVPKQSLKKLNVRSSVSHRHGEYRPDFAINLKSTVRLIAEAKAPTEELDDHIWQPRGYSILLNGSEQGKIVEYYILTNGIKTRLYSPDRNKFLMELEFADFKRGNTKLEDFLSLLAELRNPAIQLPDGENLLILAKRPLAEINAAFSWCHQHIYRKDHVSQSEAFTEFVKLISLKLMSDRDIRDAHPKILHDHSISLPAIDVKFSSEWILKNSINTQNPISDIQFQSFMHDREREIANGIRKRMFDENDRINLKPETIAGVVEKLEGIFLFGIDADLNGRLFETFLNATMRGKDLGQFFTPRSLVKLGVRLAQLEVVSENNKDGKSTDTVLDACCGSGGFLIDVLADMWAKVEKMPITAEEKSKLKDKIANKHIYGIDVANAPKLARIARLNMYLHGDGGARIYHANALDKSMEETPGDDADIIQEKRELKKLLENPIFDVAITNPPFAKAIESKTNEERKILRAYEIAKSGTKLKSSVRSNLLFIERYYDLLRPGGRLVTVLDDGILSGEEHKDFRKKLRKWFVIKAVISLPGDAFQRSNARVKTSYVIAEKRDGADSEQPPIFMYPCQYVGLDDPKRQRVRAGDEEVRKQAEIEIEEVISEFTKFQRGEKSSYSVAASEEEDRLDVKNRLFTSGRKIDQWKKVQLDPRPLDEMLALREYDVNEIITNAHEEAVRVMVVRYHGIAEESEEVFPQDSSYSKLYPVYKDDVVISNIAANYGSIAVVPESLDGAVVSSEYTVLRAKQGYDPKILHLILRSPEMRADILLSSSGANRTRAKWDSIRKLFVPYPKKAQVLDILAKIEEAETSLRRAKIKSQEAKRDLETILDLNSEKADTILGAFKPPQ